MRKWIDLCKKVIGVVERAAASLVCIRPSAGRAIASCGSGCRDILTTLGMPVPVSVSDSTPTTPILDGRLCEVSSVPLRGTCRAGLVARC